MAELKLNKKSDAKASFLLGIALVPNDKSFRDQLDKLSAEGVSSSTTTTTASATATSTTTRSTTSSPNVTKPKSKASTTAESETSVNVEEGLIRGYKKTSDGRTTTFFNNELDESTKALIGDIAPKKLDNPQASQTPATSTNLGSAWNTAGTFEERIFTPWAISRLEELFADVSVSDLPLDSVATLTKVNIVGDASVTRNRGKVKHVYDFVATCDWKLSVMDSSSSREEITGTIIMNDITGDKDYDFVTSVELSKKKPSTEGMAIVNSDVKKGRLQQRMVDICNTFYDEFKAK
jgi:DNA uptake protein ComE-like DNA-binding protein